MTTSKTLEREEFIGQIIDIFEDYLARESHEPNEVLISGDQYDLLADELSLLLKNWSVTITLQPSDHKEPIGPHTIENIVEIVTLYQYFIDHDMIVYEDIALHEATRIQLMDEVEEWSDEFEAAFNADENDYINDVLTFAKKKFREMGWLIEANNENEF